MLRCFSSKHNSFKSVVWSFITYARIAELQLVIDNAAPHYGAVSLAFSFSAVTATTTNIWRCQRLMAVGEGRSAYLAGF